MVAERDRIGRVVRALVGVAVVATALVFSATWAEAPRTTDVAPVAAGAQPPITAPALETAAASTTTVNAPAETAPEVLAAPPTATLLTVPATLPNSLLAARSVASYYTALDAGDHAGAFDHLTEARGLQLGGMESFASLWRAVDAVAAEPAVCVEVADGVECEARVRITGVDGTCAMATNHLQLQPVGDRYRIVGEQALQQESCTG